MAVLLPAHGREVSASKPAPFASLARSSRKLTTAESPTRGMSIIPIGEPRRSTTRRPGLRALLIA